MATVTDKWIPPVVDMAESDAAVVMAQACKNYGFFYLENHGVSKQLVDRVFQQSRNFFNMPLDKKMTVLADQKNRGYTPIHDETLDPKNSSKGDTKEGYYVFREIEAGGEEAQKPLRGPNRWPSEEWLPGWKNDMIEYFETMSRVGETLMSLLAEGLGLEQNFFRGFFKEAMTALRLLHYSPEKSDPERGVLAAGAHSDYGLMTMLATDDVPGLQVQLKGEWIDVPPNPGAFICNLGDMLQRWTNDYLKSTVHRVVNKAGRERYSIPFFFEPDFDTQVICIPRFCSAENPARYPPITSGEHLLGKYKATQELFKEDSSAPPV